jgi:hypothetical protein
VQGISYTKHHSNRFGGRHNLRSRRDATFVWTTVLPGLTLGQKGFPPRHSAEKAKRCVERCEAQSPLSRVRSRMRWAEESREAVQDCLLGEARSVWRSRPHFSGESNSKIPSVQILPPDLPLHSSRNTKHHGHPKPHPTLLWPQNICKGRIRPTQSYMPHIPRFPVGGKKMALREPIPKTTRRLSP